nr:uncharacterized protein LOC127347175 [Lolium perenne]
MPSRRGTAPRGVAIAGTDLVGLSFHPEQAPSRRGLLHRQDSHSRPGTLAEPFRSSQQHLARDELPQQRHGAQTAPSPAPPRHTGPHSARPDHPSSSAPPWPPPPATTNCHRAHPPSHHLPAPRSPDNQPRPRSGPGRPARRHLLPHHGHTAAAAAPSRTTRRRSRRGPRAAAPASFLPAGDAPHGPATPTKISDPPHPL